MRLSPELIAGELERLATLVEVDAADAEDAVLDMADALRRRLKGAEAVHEPTRRRCRCRRSASLLLAGSLAVAGCAPPAAATHRERLLRRRPRPFRRTGRPPRRPTSTSWRG